MNAPFREKETLHARQRTRFDRQGRRSEGRIIEDEARIELPDLRVPDLSHSSFRQIIPIDDFLRALCR